MTTETRTPRSFQDLMDLARARGRARMAVAAAQDAEVLEAVHAAVAAGLVEPILVGDRALIAPLLAKVGLPAGTGIVHEEDMARASLAAADLVRTGAASVLMKGLVNSAVFLKAALDAERGLRSGRLLSHLAVLEVPGDGRLRFFTDGGMNIAPGLEEKKVILANALEALRGMGIHDPKVAVLCANEQVSAKMPATVDAQALVEAWQAGAFPGCMVEGPIAMDVALSPAAAAHKGLASAVSGAVDLFLMPNIEAGNMVTKALLHWTGATFAGAVLGATRPIVMGSRSDTAAEKLNAIAMAVLQA